MNNWNHKEQQSFKKKSPIFLKRLKFGNKNSLKSTMIIMNVKNS